MVEPEPLLRPHLLIDRMAIKQCSDGRRFRAEMYQQPGHLWGRKQPLSRTVASATEKSLCLLLVCVTRLQIPDQLEDTRVRCSQSLFELAMADAGIAICAPDQPSQFRSEQKSSCATFAGGGHAGQRPSPKPWRSKLRHLLEEQLQAASPLKGLLCGQMHPQHLLEAALTAVNNLEPLDELWSRTRSAAYQMYGHQAGPANGWCSSYRRRRTAN
mmetsp:Transcript_87285/g.262363  ORF Transcript_87285/g.262363 Transcript_87285/m.262363 type:complete len:214 (-) Transcript_87285:1644-2285(-)